MMRPRPADTPESIALRTWLMETVLADHGYEPELIGEPFVLYERPHGGTFLAGLMDGLPAMPPPWAGSKQPSVVFFKGLRRYLNEIPSQLAQALNHDGAFWEVRTVYRPGPQAYLHSNLALLHREPAEEAGATYLMLVADDRQSAIILEDDYDDDNLRPFFRITFYGTPERRTRLLHHLEEEAAAIDRAVGK